MEAKTSLFDMTGSIHIDGLDEMQEKFDKLNQSLTATVSLLEKIGANDKATKKQRIVFLDDECVDIPSDDFEWYPERNVIQFYKNNAVVAFLPLDNVKYILSK